MDDIDALLGQMRIIGVKHLLVAAAFCRRIGLIQCSQTWQCCRPAGRWPRGVLGLTSPVCLTGAFLQQP